MLSISLIICTYQRSNEIRRLLKALMSQTRIPDEIIVVDGSLDNTTESVTKEFIEIFSGRLVYVHVDKTDRGLTRQRNVGIKLAKSEIIAFLDDDTIPEPDYFEQIHACFLRHPEAIGVGGTITNEIEWKKAGSDNKPGWNVFRWEEWERRENWRWRVRKLLGLDSPLPPGWMPPFGHGRPANYPPDGKDYRVEFVMGGCSNWRRSIFEKILFSSFFIGYGLYEDLDFCIRASRLGSIYQCTRARLRHEHALGGRPNRFKYGKMVVRNGWYVWRRRWNSPPFFDRVKWWAITLLLALLRLIDFRNQGYIEAFGRFAGILSVLIAPPIPDNEHD